MYVSLARVLIFLGNGVLLQTAFRISLLRENLSHLRVYHVIDANAMLREALSVDIFVYFPKPDHQSSIFLCPLSDGSHPRDRYYG